ncbi:MAG: hypothetical protein MJA31_12305 [Clostridia bacterium]|nr:hypothetical protein [Clostridia bacterium]
MIKEIENFINKINSVICSRIVLENDEIKEIHIVSNMEKSPKQLSRDIQSILISKFNIDVDYKKISVAQVDDESTIAMADFRLKLSSIEHTTRSNIFEAKVVLETDGTCYEGTSSGPNSANNVYKLLALAVINAVESFFDKKDIFILEDVLKVMVTGKEAFITLITTFENGKELLLSGSSVAGRNSDEMVVKSALDAINRVVLKLSRDYQTG